MEFLRMEIIAASGNYAEYGHIPGTVQHTKNRGLSWSGVGFFPVSRAFLGVPGGLSLFSFDCWCCCPDGALLGADRMKD